MKKTNLRDGGIDYMREREIYRDEGVLSRDMEIEWDVYRRDMDRERDLHKERERERGQRDA